MWEKGNVGRAEKCEEHAVPHEEGQKSKGEDKAGNADGFMTCF